MTDEARNKIFHKLRAAIDRVANDPGAEWFSGAHWDVMAWINDDLVAFESRVRAEVAEEIADAIEMNVRNPDFDKQDRGGWPDFPSKMAYVAGHDNAAKIARLAAGSSPDTTKEIDGTDRPADEAIVPPPASAGFNPAYRVARCGQGSAHSPHVMEHGPDQPRNCPGGEAL